MKPPEIQLRFEPSFPISPKLNFSSHVKLQIARASICHRFDSLPQNITLISKNHDIGMVFPRFMRLQYLSERAEGVPNEEARLRPD